MLKIVNNIIELSDFNGPISVWQKYIPKPGASMQNIKPIK